MTQPNQSELNMNQIEAIISDPISNEIYPAFVTVKGGETER